MSNASYVKTNSERVWQRHMDLSEIGKTAAGGVHRPALTDEDIAAHVKIAEWATARSFAVELDAMGNMFVCRAGSNPSATPVASGSHTDSHPYAGRFDGPLGVLASQRYRSLCLRTSRKMHVEQPASSHTSLST